MNTTVSHQSEWITLEQGEYYFMETQHLEYNWSDHMSVAVEYEMANSTGHHHANKEIQIVEANPTNVYEKFNVTVNSQTGASYKLKFVNPRYDPKNVRSIQIWTTNKLEDTYSASQFSGAVWRYWNDIWGSGINVELTMFDTNGVETTDSANATQRVYTVTVKRLISEQSFTMAMVDTTNADVTVGAPYSLSSAPLRGSF